MAKTAQEFETYSEAETVARREAALKYAITTPPKPHQTMGKGRKRASQSEWRFRRSPIVRGMSAGLGGELISLPIGIYIAAFRAVR